MRFPRPAWFFLAVSLCIVALPGARAAMPDVPAEAEREFAAGRSVDLIVEYYAAAVESEVAQLRRQAGPQRDNGAVLGLRAQRYAEIKARIHSAMNSDSDRLLDYSHLPMDFRRFRSRSGLQALLSHPDVKAVFAQQYYQHGLVHSLPFIGENSTAAVGDLGTGTTVVVIDDGINVANSAFAPCSSAGTPATCHVVAALNIGTATGSSDTTHGTNVAAIVLGVAPGANVAALNAFSGTNASSSDVIAGIDWAISNSAALHIAAVNMSLGDTSVNTSPCSSPTANPFVTPVAQARSAGITVVAAAGNQGLTNSISNPGCTPGVVSVGAVYDFNWGSQSWGVCSDASTAPDQIACFSNTANYLSILAPGAIITAAGLTFAGTSQATPHVAGAIAVLRAARPSDTLDQTLAHLTSTGVTITDTRNGVNIAKPRLNLFAAVNQISSGNQDVPTLPQWAAALLAIALTVAAGRRLQRGIPSPRA